MYVEILHLGIYRTELGLVMEGAVAKIWAPLTLLLLTNCEALKTAVHVL